MEKLVKVAVDAMGGDNAPGEIVKGAVDAVNERNNLKVFLVGMFAVLFIEIFQYMTRLGSFDIDDIILNMVGVLSGYGTFGLVNHVLLKER